ncbi:interleukin-1 receptor-associated kinase 1 [Plakobranchus ocellatus]|uniref:Interleukin-1 receptor-associated kinase 1 n=1 Tax=Plakobranchus ocellatus TaxID=259542 RepID=A0AAV3XWI1_9GAST|nr:interleukin-1 receptor-associated kinase 1 [Plakobranchus ocellatus]
MASCKPDIANTSLCDIDFSVTNALMRAMDFDEGWEELASKVGYNTQQVLRLRDFRYRPNGSPTNILLWELGCEGYKVLDLYEKLKAIRRKREMEILEEYGKLFSFPHEFCIDMKKCHTVNQ